MLKILSIEKFAQIFIKKFITSHPELASAHYEEDEAVKAKKWEPIRAETIPFFLGKLEALATENDGYLALKKLTLADVYLTGLVTYIKSMLQVDDLGDKYPNLKRVVKNVKAVDGIKEWVEKRPKSEW
jgi:glutathione S-transferase